MHSHKSAARPRGRPKATATRERIVAEAMRLFSQHGYRSTTIADIQQACGLSRSSGGLYRHFRSKREVLEAGIEREVQHVEALRIVSAFGQGLGELRPEVEVLGRFVLLELAAERELLRILLHEADQFPDIVADARERLVRPVYELAAAWVRGHVEAGRFPDVDPEATAAVLLGAIGQYPMLQALTGDTPGGVDEERFLQAWIRFVMGLAQEGTP